MATAFAIIVVARQRGSGLFGKTHIALALGLACWLAGQTIWAYETFADSREPSESSIADIPWLAFYAFLGYYIFKMYKYFGKTVSKYNLILVSGLVVALTINTVYSTFIAYEKGLHQTVKNEDLPSFSTAVVRSAYPVLDAIIVMPALLLLVTLRRGLLTYTPWLFSSLALVLTAGADMLFTNMALLDRADLSTFAYTLYNAGNLAFAGGLYWYNRFVIYNEKKLLEEFQRQNR